MQTTIESDQTRGRPVGLLLSTTIGALALTVAGFVGIGGLPDKPATPAPASAIGDTGTREQLLVYLVATEADKRALSLDVLNSPEWFGDSYAGSKIDVRIIAPGARGEESLDSLARRVPEASLTTLDGPSVKLVDMR